MRKLFRVFKRILQIGALALFTLLAILYTVVSLPKVQDNVRTKAQTMLSETLEVPLEISRVKISPFNRIEIFGVTIPDQQGDTLLYAHKIGAGINLWQLIKNGRISLNNIQLFGVDAHITRPTPNDETNLQFVIDAFKPQEKREKKPIDLCINSALIRRSRIRYDVLSEPHRSEGLFDVNHIDLNDITSSLSMKHFDKDSINVHIKRLTCKEKSGLNIERLTLRVSANRQLIKLTDFLLQLPHSNITTERSTIDISNINDSHSFADNANIALDISQSNITLSDLSPLIPALREFSLPIALNCHAHGTLNDIRIKHLSLNMNDDDIALNASAHIANALLADSIDININTIQATTSQEGIASLCQNLGLKETRAINILDEMGISTLNGRLVLTPMHAEGNITLFSQLGDILSDISITRDSINAPLHCIGYIESDGLHLNKILGEKSKLGLTAFNLEANTILHSNKPHYATLTGKIDRLDYNNYSYNDITLYGKYRHNNISGRITMDDINGSIDAHGTLSSKKDSTSIDVKMACKDLDLAAFNLAPQTQGKTLSFNIDAGYTGTTIDDANGVIDIHDIIYGNNEQQMEWNQILVEVRNDTHPHELTISSDYINGKVSGEYTTTTLPRTIFNMAAPLLPSLIEVDKTASRANDNTMYNDLEWNISIRPNVEMSHILQLPFTLTDTANIDGYIKESERDARIDVSIPNVWMGKTHIEDVSLRINHNNELMNITAQAGLMNKKKQLTIWSINGQAHNDNIDVGIHWNTNTETTYCGSIKLDSQLSRKNVNKNGLNVAVNILPTDIIINDTIWNIKPACITIEDKEIAVNNLEVSRPSQHIYIDGLVSENPEDTLHVDLQDISLDYIFETLNINYVTFGGRATGRVDAANLFSKTPYLCTQELDVENFSYNNAVFGDLAILGQFDTHNMGILLKGNITNHRGEESFVDGYIFPTQDSLSISFNVDHVPLKFIEPFVQQIFVDVEGEASGEVVLEGNFARISLRGDAFAHYFSFGVPFLNTHYHLTDSVHFTDSKIYFNNVTAYDDYGNTAIADGEIKHRYFMQLDYDIDIHDADNLLVFNIPRTPGAMYYGTIFGSGNAKIKGNDFHTDIEANMHTDKESVFTFAITNTTSAIDYQFLTFSNNREIKPNIITRNITKEDSLVALNNSLMEQKVKPQLPPPPLSVSVIANITPDAEIVLMMNEMTGDNMTAKGEGELRLDYNTSDNEIKMFGTVTINNGNYDFSIEDIITRDFKINQGSSVSFQGNPLDAHLNIEALYQAQANLADLDDSFITDSELSSTIVPVHTILHINGKLTQPDIGFDIKLPTLSADMDNKIHSIISTDDMMTRQVIYLLALNRFFTPEYNTAQSRNNDLTSVATSTLTSSIGALLGQIDENWNISPKIRSELGDFSDVEVDLFLSSQLLNNRLIFNGNFGYRDSRYSSTNFIGDFDIEYLLTESGNLRLKGYNHFNDRNYTVRTALTTQGLGLMYKLDFNTWRNLFEFAKPNPSKKEDEENDEERESIASPHHNLEQPTDTVITTITDIFH